MDNSSRQVTIHLSRSRKPVRHFQEGFVDDNGIRLKTFSIVTESVSADLSEKFHQQGWILRDQQIHSASKYHFYREFFSIVEYHDRGNKVLGYYCDIATPLQRNGNEYFLTDLILDLWVSPDLQVFEIDQNEFEVAIASGRFPSNLERDALVTFNRLKSEVEKGIFPTKYLS